MKQRVTKDYDDKVKSLYDSNLNVDENVWFDLTSSWSKKDIEKKNMTVPEVGYTGSASRLFVWVIMDLHVEDPGSKNLRSRRKWNSMYLHHQGNVAQRYVCNKWWGIKTGIIVCQNQKNWEEMKRSSGQIQGQSGDRMFCLLWRWLSFKLVWWTRS